MTAFALFALVLLSALALASSSKAAVESPPPPQVWSDKADYAPGEAVSLSGANWAPGESVHIRVNDDAGETWRHDADVIAADDGTISDRFNLPNWFVAVYSVTATGATSGAATWSFTDGNINGGTLSIRESTCTTAQGSFTSGSTVCAHAAVTIQGGGPTTWAIQWYAPGVNPQVGPAADAASFTETAGTANATRDDSFTVSTAGTWTVLICKTGDTEKCSAGNTIATATFTVTGNAAPVIARNNASVTVNEGQTASNTGTWSDANAGDTVALSASVGTVTKAGSNAAGTWSWSFGATDGPAQSQTVTITADDGTTSASTTFSLVVNNVAPTATFGAPVSVDEGSNINLSLTSPSDPSSVDTAAGFTYAFDCGSGYGAFSATSTASCSTNDDGTRSVKGQIKDKDGGVNEYTSSVAIANVAPSVSLTGPDDVNENETGSELYSFTVTDPGADAFDVSAGYPKCGTGGALVVGSLTTSASGGSFRCRFADGPASPTVEMQVRDHDEGVSSTTADSNVDSIAVTVHNVAPTVTFAAGNDTTVDEGSTPHAYAFSVSDPGDDTFTVDSHGCGLYGTEVAGSLTTNASGGSFDCTFPDGPSSSSVNVKVSDSDGASDTDSEAVQVVAVANVAPAIAFTSAPAAVDESTSANVSYSFSVSDPGDDSSAYASGYPDCGANGSLQGTPTIGATSGSFQCRFPDGDASSNVSVKVNDGDDDSNLLSQTVAIANVAPTGSFPATRTVDEGSSSTFAFTGQSDPSGVDTAAGFHYAFSCTNGSLAASTYASSGTSASVNCPASAFDDGPGSQTIRARIIDKDGGHSEYTTAVTIANVAPSAAFASPGPVNEGSSFTLSLTSPIDPSSADYAAGFTYAFDCGSGYGAFSSTNTATCSTNDDGTRTVKGKVRDKDNDAREYTASVTVNNVAPSATFSDTGPVDEGSSFTISLADPTDPSSVDTAAGFQYAFDCGSGYAAYGSATSRSCPTTDNGVRAVKGRIKDKDGGEREYTGSVTVNNVRPDITSVTASNTFAGPLVFMTSSISTVFTDPGSADTWTNLLTFSDGGTQSGASSNPAFFSAQGGDAYKFTLTHGFVTPGCKTVTSKVSDDDGGFDTFGPTPVNVGTGEFLPPMTNTPVTNKLKNGQVLPVKIKLTDCSGAPISTLSPAIVLKKGDMTVFNDDSVVAITPGSVSGADTTGVMRSNGDGSYIYNMSVNITLNTDYTILIYPYGTGAPTQYLAHVIQATR